MVKTIKDYLFIHYSFGNVQLTRVNQCLINNNKNKKNDYKNRHKLLFLSEFEKNNEWYTIIFIGNILLN